MKLRRSTFLTLSSAVALAVGTFAMAAPQALLESKGVALPNEGATIWVRELGVTIFALGLMMFLVRNHADSPTLAAIFVVNAVVQLGLLPIEVVAYHRGVITRLSGIVPNSVLHIVLASGFVTFGARVRRNLK
jgi:hypothetical protein